MCDTIDHQILMEYELVKKIGKGAYGQVWKVIHKPTRKVYAIKKIYDAFRNTLDSRRTYRQISCLEHFHHQSIVKLHTWSFASQGEDIYLTMEYLSSDLANTLKAQQLKSIQKQYIFTQLVSAVYYLHSGDYVHRDLKPANVLINASCEVKLADFGLVRKIGRGDEEVLTGNIATRWYKAPQMLLGAEVYGKGVDIWSLGCILAEIYSGKPIFCGNSTYSQLEKIIEVCGCRLISPHPTIKSQTSLAILESFPRHTKKSFRQILPDAEESVIDLLQKMLEFDPTKRITIDQVINHAYLNRFREKVTIRSMQKSNMEINCEKLTKEECWNLLKQKQKTNPSYFSNIQNAPLNKIPQKIAPKSPQLGKTPPKTTKVMHENRELSFREIPKEKDRVKKISFLMKQKARDKSYIQESPLQSQNIKEKIKHIKSVQVMKSISDKKPINFALDPPMNSPREIHVFTPLTPQPKKSESKIVSKLRKDSFQDIKKAGLFLKKFNPPLKLQKNPTLQYSFSHNFVKYQ